ncbi:hypothetical protein J4526_01480 [Desulfurococcaceae archaeon MEX13E-LK6-19]|nr:hypothetical protein J4526_01480 [Desulfurococcaceae archaeon MEX13E-LK6-19]
MKVVDCRKCRFFRSIEELPEPVLINAWAWIEENRPGSRLLGYCTRYDRPVTHYRGRCYGFKPREEQWKPAKYTITEWLEKIIGQ